MKIGLSPRLLAPLLVGALALTGPVAAAGSQGQRSLRAHQPRHLSFAVARAHAKALGQHVCEDIDDPDPCYAAAVHDCERLTARKINCRVEIHWYDGSDNDLWTMHVFYRKGEVTQSEGRSECEEPCG